MIPPTVNQFCDLTHFLSMDDWLSEVKVGAAFVNWDYLVRKDVERGVIDEGIHDSVLTQHGPLSTPRMALIFHLATVDFYYFKLAKRMAVKTLAQRTFSDPGLRARLSMAWLLAGTPPKNSKKVTLGRDVQIITSIAVLMSEGLGKYRNKLTNPSNSNSAISSFCELLDDEFGRAPTYAAVEKIWDRRIEKLKKAGFEDRNIDDFLSRCFLNQRTIAKAAKEMSDRTS